MKAFEKWLDNYYYSNRSFTIKPTLEETWKAALEWVIQNNCSTSDIVKELKDD